MAPPRKLTLLKIAERVHDSPLYQMFQEAQTQINTLFAKSVSGRAVLRSGSVIVFCPTVEPTSEIQLTYETISGIAGTLSAPVSGRIKATSFTIVSSAGGDNSTVVWKLEN